MNEDEEFQQDIAEGIVPNKRYKNAISIAHKFSLRHVFRAGAIVWVKYKGKDYYLVFKSLSRPNRGVQIPGGRVERYENPGQTVVREVKEETGVDVHIVCPLAMGFFENKDSNHSNMQIYYIVKPNKPINISKTWNFTDKDATKQKMECWFVSTDEKTEFLSVGQDKIIDMFKQWLNEHKRENNVRRDESEIITPLVQL